MAENKTERSDTLLEDLFRAYFDARRHKRNTRNQLRFEMDLEANLIELYDQIRKREYRVGPSVCFIVEHPVKREIFAADFRDRVVHHLLFNYIAPLFERTFITDSYSCLKNKGTLYGVERLEHHIRSCSDNYRQTCYVLKLDIQGYFMNINRRIMYETIERVMLKMGPRKSHRGRPWNELLDYDLVLYLLREVVFNDPTENCIVRGSRSKWADLPRSKSLFTSPADCGLPIGNLTSQLFSNIYLNDFDHFVKRKLKHKHYGRYVDDFYIIHRDKELLKRHIREIDAYLQENLGLTLHPKKIYLQEISKGVTFLGAVVKPYRRYMVNRTRNHFSELLAAMNAYIRMHPRPSKTFLIYMQAAMNSYLGYMTHYKCYKMKLKLVPRMGEVLKLGSLTHNMTRYRLNRDIRERLGLDGRADALPWEMECLSLPREQADEDFVPDDDGDWASRRQMADETDALLFGEEQGAERTRPEEKVPQGCDAGRTSGAGNGEPPATGEGQCGV